MPHLSPLNWIFTPIMLMILIMMFVVMLWWYNSYSFPLISFQNKFNSTKLWKWW